MSNNQIQRVQTPGATIRQILNAPTTFQQFKEILGENTSGYLASIIELFSDKSSKLHLCNPTDVVRQALIGAAINLPINKNLGYSWIIPRQKSYKINGQWTKVWEPSYQIGYKGYIQLAIRTMNYKFIHCDVVREGQTRIKNFLTGEVFIKGEPISNTPIGYIAHFEMINGFSKTIYKTREEVINHAIKYSKAYTLDDNGNLKSDSVWFTNEEEMGQKTVLTELLKKWGLLSTQLIKALEAEAENDTPSIEDATHEEISEKANQQPITMDDNSPSKALGEAEQPETLNIVSQPTAEKVPAAKKEKNIEEISKRANF